MPALLPKSLPRPDTPDADLLRRFVRDRDEAAFAELVRRFGPLVFGVCRRVLPDAHLAEDAFQAAFVVLARKADGVRANQLPAWLHGVARKVALRARTMVGRRSKRETLTADPPEVAVLPTEPDDTAALDEAIADLPRHYRDAVILCELQGVARADAAQRLGLAEGTLSSRLAKARKLLAEALSRKGVALPVTMASVSVPSGLCAAAVRAAVNAAPSFVSALADGVTRTMLLSKLKLPAVLGAFAVVLLGLAGGPQPDTASAAPVPKELADRGLLWVFDATKGELSAYTPDGKPVKVVTLPGGKIAFHRFFGLTRDGQHALYAEKTGVALHDEDTDPKGTPVLTVHLLPLHSYGKPKPTDTGIDFQVDDFVTASEDGRHIYRCRHRPPGEWKSERPTFAVTRFDLDGKNPTGIDVPEHLRPREIRTDSAAVFDEFNSDEAPHPRVHLAAPGEKPKLVKWPFDLEHATLSPDGKTLLAAEVRSARADPDAEYATLAAFDPATGKPKRIDSAKGIGSIRGFWSPDGGKVAYQWHGKVATKSPDPFSTAWRVGAGEIVVCDADGGNPKRILELEDRGGALVLRRHLLGWFPASPPAVKRNAPVPKEKDHGIVWMLHPATGEVIGYTPDGKKAHAVKLADGAIDPMTFLGITRDGRHALVAAKKGVVPVGKQAGYEALHARTLTVHLRPLFGDGKPTDTGIPCWYGNLYVSGHDGKSLFVTRDIAPRVPDGETPKPPEYETTAYDLTTFKGTKQPALEKGFHLVAELATGDQVLSKYVHDGAPRQSFHLLPAAGGKPQPLTGKDETDYCALSPDGTKLLVTRQFSSKSKPGDSFHRMFVIDRATGKATQIAEHPDTQSAQGFWSPDGKRIAYQWYEEGQRPFVQQIGRLVPVPISRGEAVVCDADGSNPKVLLKLDGNADEDIARFQDWWQSKPRLIGWFPTQPPAK